MRIRLVFVPGRQARLDLLCPKTTPLILTGMLRNEGLFADYMDFGSLAAFSSHKKDGHLEGDNGKTSCHFWNRSDHSFSFRQTADTTQDAAIGTAILHAAPSLIVWYVKNRDDYHTVKSISRYIRQQAPETHQTLIGPYITCYGASALNNFSSIDTGITGDQLSALIALSENIHTPESWGRIPGLIFHNRSGITCSTKNIYPVRNLLPPDFAAFSCQNDCPTKQGQFSLYPLSFVCNYSPEYGLKPGAIRPLQKSVPHLFDEMQTLNTCYGAGAFHIEAPHVAAPALERFADTLLENNFMTLYSLGGLTEAFSAPLADRLFASGCRAVGFHTPSGSQRLLEDFYGCNMSISALRATLRHCRAAGLFTVAHLRYPCPHDDYHSRAETELFLEACRPDGVTIEAPELMPESIWFTRAPEYGFLLDHRSFQHWIECSPKQRGAPPYRMQGWKKGHAEEARGTLEAMAESLG
ncbi:MAG: hypothetical protein KAH38_07430, partial [Candidatus Hydrogenedentes bacterium]|nr:hypothetical protein [Candidatus Hydrogenedentota bacterium]